MKRIIAFAVVLVLLGCVAAIILGNMTTIRLEPALSVNGMTAECSAHISGRRASDTLSAKLILRQGEREVASWTAESKGVLDLHESSPVNPGFTYTLTLEASINGAMQAPKSVSAAVFAGTSEDTGVPPSFAAWMRAFREDPEHYRIYREQEDISEEIYGRFADGETPGQSLWEELLSARALYITRMEPEFQDRTEEGMTWSLNNRVDLYVTVEGVLDHLWGSVNGSYTTDATGHTITSCSPCFLEQTGSEQRSIYREQSFTQYSSVDRSGIRATFNLQFDLETTNVSEFVQNRWMKVCPVYIELVAALED